MLADAKRLARQGRAVYVLAANPPHCRHLIDLAGGQDALDALGIKIETPPPSFDWKTLTLVGAHPNVRVLVDHYAIESTFKRALSMLHAYDEDSDHAE
jgi:hypothetical protein